MFKILLFFGIITLGIFITSLNFVNTAADKINATGNITVTYDLASDFVITNMSIIPNRYDNGLTLLGFMENDWGTLEGGKEIKLSITSYDKHNNLIGVDTGLLEYSISDFNDKTPFEISLSIPDKDKIIDHVDIKIIFYTPLFG